jgi:ribosomal protein L21E
MRKNKMLRKKKVRERGKVRLSEYFKELKEGDRVSIVRELSQKAGFPKTIQGRTGTIEGKRGNSYVVNVRIGKEKRFIVHPIHLKKLV